MEVTRQPALSNCVAHAGGHDHPGGRKSAGVQPVLGKISGSEFVPGNDGEELIHYLRVK